MTKNKPFSNAEIHIIREIVCEWCGQAVQLGQSEMTIDSQQGQDSFGLCATILWHYNDRNYLLVKVNNARYSGVSFDNPDQPLVLGEILSDDLVDCVRGVLMRGDRY
jgi:hypothetical protein